VRTLNPKQLVMAAGGATNEPTLCFSDLYCPSTSGTCQHDPLRD
jgi:hypothetical protein